MELKTVAYPKVNLHLAVGKKRADGFHEIQSIFQLVEDPLYNDKITVLLEKSNSLSVKVKGLEGIADSDNNTIVKACRLFSEISGFVADITVIVDKNIPSQAGLGGGSSDAGAVLRLLNSVYPVGLERLIYESDKIGSDVPFFVCGCKAAVVTGKGEKVLPIEPRNLKITLHPNDSEKISTAEAYKKLDERDSVRPFMSVENLIEMYNGPVESWSFFNDFDQVNCYSGNSDLRLSGSGSCRFTID